MKTILLIGACLAMLLPLRGDIIANGDFHNGKANWKGNIHAASDSATNDISSIDHPSDAKGVIVDLKNYWSIAFQTFDSHDKSLDYTITYQLSADYAPGKGTVKPPQIPLSNPARASNPPNMLLSYLLGGSYSGDLEPPKGNNFLLLVVDLTDGSFSSAVIHPATGKTDAQTATGTLSNVPPHDEKTFYLVFSGGTGTVTLLNVALTPTPKPQTDLDNGLH